MKDDGPQIFEGQLKKRDFHGKIEATKLWRSRYFVLDKIEGELKYYDSKTKRKLNFKARKIPLRQLLWVKVRREKEKKVVLYLSCVCECVALCVALCMMLTLSLYLSLPLSHSLSLF